MKRCMFQFAYAFRALIRTMPKKWNRDDTKTNRRCCQLSLVDDTNFTIILLLKELSSQWQLLVNTEKQFQVQLSFVRGNSTMSKDIIESVSKLNLPNFYHNCFSKLNLPNCMNTNTQTHKHTTNKHINTHTHKHTNTRTHKHTSTHTQAHKHASTQTQTHANT